MPEPRNQLASAASPGSRPLPREGGRGDGPQLVGRTDDGNPRVAIVGAGPVGLSLALSLHRAGIACRVLDARPRGAVGADRRVLALSHGTRQILDRLGVWHGLRTTPIRTIHVSQRGGLGRTLITAEEAGLPALGYVAEAGVLGAALAAACEEAGITTTYDTRVTGTHPDAERVRVESEAARPEGRGLRHESERRLAAPGSTFVAAQPASNGGACAATRGQSRQDGAPPLEAELVAWAEGAVEETREVVRRHYGQEAIVATLHAREPHGNLAFERFTPTGPIALLPHETHYALVAAVPQAQAATLLSCDEPHFLAWLQESFGARVHFTAARERIAFPLGLRYRREAVGARTVWLGNAAQTLHPVAGQGFNLALRDVSELARLLSAAPDCGAPALLARYARGRRLDRRGVIGFTDTLVRLFSDDNAVLQHARGAGLLLLDMLPAARNFFARRMIFGARAWP